jgi:hypothetical protein
VQYSAVQCSAVQCSAVQCSAVQCSAVQCSAEDVYLGGMHKLMESVTSPNFLKNSLTMMRFPQLVGSSWDSSRILLLVREGILGGPERGGGEGEGLRSTGHRHAGFSWSIPVYLS